MISLENKSEYLPKPKENLIKKYVSNLPALFDKVNIVLEMLDCRNVRSCVNEEFRKECKAKGIKIISVLTKADTVKTHIEQV